MDLNRKILTTVSKGVAYLRLNKPAKLNALDEEMLVEIRQRFAEWERSRAIVVVVLTSTSERAFCVGADIEVLSQFDEESMRAWEVVGGRVLDCIQSSPLISIASIGGYCLGGGLTLAAACDFRIASMRATFGQPEIGLGWIPGWGGIARLNYLVGAPRTKELCMTAHRITASEAQVIGLVNHLVGEDELAPKTDQFAEELAKQDAGALGAIKSLTSAPASGVAGYGIDALLNAALLNNERGQAAIAKSLAKKGLAGGRER